MRRTTAKKGVIKAYPSMLEGEEAARCDALKCGGTYADFVPLIPRDADENQYKDRTRDGNEGDAPKDGSIPVVPFTIPFDILEGNVFFMFSSFARGCVL
jgi:hypothetical protein